MKDKVLLIIDLQKEFIQNINSDYESNYEALEIYNYLNENIKYISSFDKVFNIVDIINYDYDSEWRQKNTLDNWVYISNKNMDKLLNNNYCNVEEIIPYNKYITDTFFKEYWFFREYIDDWIDDFIIIELWKILLMLNLYDIRDLSSKNYNLMTSEKLKHTDFFKYEDLWAIRTLYLPSTLINDIINNININDEIILIWWWLNECLKEIMLLLNILWYNNVKINNNLIYS